MRKWRTGLGSVVTKLEEILHSYESFVVGRTPSERKRTYDDRLPLTKVKKKTRTESSQGLTPKTVLYRLRESIREVEELIVSDNPDKRMELESILGRTLEEHLSRLNRDYKFEQSRFIGRCVSHMNTHLPHLREEYDDLLWSSNTEVLFQYLDDRVYPHYIERRKKKRLGVVMDCPEEILQHRNEVLEILRMIEDYMEEEETVTRDEFFPEQPTPYHLVHKNTSGSRVPRKRKTERKNRPNG